MTKFVHKSEDTAKQIASKKSKKTKVEHFAVQANGGWTVMTQDEIDAQASAAPVEQVAEAAAELAGEAAAHIAAEASSEAPAKKSKKPKDPNAAQLVSLFIAGAKISKGFVYTPAIEGKQRWFDCNRVKAVEASEGEVKGVTMICSRSTLTSRGLSSLAETATVINTEQVAA